MNENIEKAVTYKEALPDSCPPADALDATNIVLYRLVSSNPPTAEDFKSHRELNPTKKYNVSECQARSLSIKMTEADAINLCKSPRLKGKLVAKVTVEKDSGKYKQTSSDVTHHSWWLYQDFDPLPCSQVVYDGAAS